MSTSLATAYRKEPEFVGQDSPTNAHMQDENSTGVFETGSNAKRVAFAVGPFVPPKVLTRARVPYPINAYQRRSEGEVEVLVTISDAGALIDAAIQKSSGDVSLDDASLVAVRGYQFKSAFRNNAPVRAHAVVTIYWRITPDTVAESYFLAEPKKKTIYLSNGLRPPDGH
jgi:TonB family protein